MKRKYSYLYILSLLLCMIPRSSKAEVWEITLRETIERAKEYSPDAIAARHSFRAAYWSWRSFKATLLPSLTFTSSPNLNRSISSVPLEDGSEIYVHKNQLSIDAGLTVNQNIPFTGGSLFVYTDLQRRDIFSDHTHSYKSNPVVIGYTQNLFGYNSIKWNKKIEPVRYSEAKKRLVETLEEVALTATGLFFNLVNAQSSWEMAQYNYANADTLYQYANGRYEIGTITENEMLQLELNLLSEQNNILKARMEIDNCIEGLKSFLAMGEETELIAKIEETIPSFQVSPEEALLLSKENNTQLETYQRLLLESESNIASEKAKRGFVANLYMEFGLSQTDRHFSQAYRNPNDQQLVSVGIQIPIVDWGVGKGKVKVAKSNRDKIHTEVTQKKIDLDMYIIRMVKQFNLQEDRVKLAGKTDQIAQRRSEVARKLYLLGKSDILDLNASITEKDNSRRAYVSALYDYWKYYYILRGLTGYDFEQNRLLTEDFEYLMK